ncbi:MAG TPA: hypothetical protein VGN51_18935 [Acidimicrobiia bacterium]
MTRLLRSMDARDGQLDEATADRLVHGQLPVDDAPPQFRGVAELVTVLRAEPSDEDAAREQQAVARIAAEIRSSTPAPRPASNAGRRLARLAAASAVVTMTAFGGLAAAGALPGPAQQLASDVLGQLHIDVPSPDGANHEHRGNSGADTDSPSASSSDSGRNHGDGQGQGSSTSNLATDPSATSIDKGAAVSAVASDGQSQAGEEHDAVPPVDTPADTPVGPPDSIRGVGPPDDVPGRGPPDSVPGRGPPDDVPGRGPPDDVPGATAPRGTP